MSRVDTDPFVVLSEAPVEALPRRLWRTYVTDVRAAANAQAR